MSSFFGGQMGTDPVFPQLARFYLDQIQGVQPPTDPIPSTDIGKKPIREYRSLGGGRSLADYYQEEVDRLRNVSGDYSGARDYQDVMDGKRPAYEVTGDMSVSPYWRKRAYNETPTQTAGQRRDKQRRHLSAYGGHQARPNFDDLDHSDPKARKYMARKFKEAGMGVVPSFTFSEQAYLDALDKKAERYNERRKKRRKRIADNIQSPQTRQTGTDRNRNRRSFGLVPSERGRQAQRAAERQRTIASMFGSFRGF